MSHKRHCRPAEEITRAIDRMRGDDLIPFDHLTGAHIVVGEMDVRLSQLLLERWAQDGKSGGAGRVWLDAVKWGQRWFTSEAAVARFLRDLGAVPVG